MPSGTVRDMERDNVIRASLKHFIRTVLLQVTFVRLPATIGTVKPWAVANPSPSVEVCLTGMRIVEALQDDESGKALDTSDRTFKDLIGASEMKPMDDGNNYRWINLFALQIGHVDLEVPEGILGQPNFVRWRPPGDIHSVCLPHHRDD